jgi:hypothetical protein
MVPGEPISDGLQWSDRARMLLLALSWMSALSGAFLIRGSGLFSVGWWCAIFLIGASIPGYLVAFGARWANAWSLLLLYGLIWFIQSLGDRFVSK